MRRGFRIVVCAAVLTLSTLVLAPTIASAGGEVRNYNLGVVKLPDASGSPVKLWGAIGVPSTAGTHPVVVVAHGRHGACPRPRWPCWKDERRSDLGLRHIVAALAGHGVAAIAPDLNAAFATGWGGVARTSHRTGWNLIVERTLAALGEATAGGGGNFGLPLAGRLDLDSPGLLGHSLSGADAVRYARERPASALLLLAPVFDGATPPDIPTAIVGSACDNDVPGQGRRYVQAAGHIPRNEPLYYVHLEGANHNHYNSRLAHRDDLGRVDAKNGCSRAERLTRKAQQRWIDRFAAAFFVTELLGTAPPGWMQLDAPFPARIYGLSVGYDRIPPGA